MRNELHTCKKPRHFDAYLNFLEQQATSIGKQLKHDIRNLLPHAIIGVYQMTLPGSWFYRGLLRV